MLIFVMIFVVMLAGWLIWLIGARVAVYQMTNEARVEVESAAHPVAAEVAGRVTQSSLIVGRKVAAGEVLITLDAAQEIQSREEAKISRETYLAMHDELVKEIQAEEQAAALASAAQSAAINESNSLIHETEAQSVLAEKEERMTSRLRSSGSVSEIEYLRVFAELQKSRASFVGAQQSRLKLGHDWGLEAQERHVRIAHLKREAAELMGAAHLEEAVIAKLDHAVSQRSIRAPVDGQLGEVAEIRIGSVITVAQQLATVVPLGPPRGVAYFPAASVGRIQPEQHAKMRCDGYPWTQFGTIPARVSNVGNEPVGDLIRVELELVPGGECAIPLTHGLPGSVEIEVERVSPLTLILRAAGQWLAPRESKSKLGSSRPAANRVVARIGDAP